jgi:hypothetical protein
MDLLRRPNKVRLGDYGFMDTGYHLSRFRNNNIYFVFADFGQIQTGLFKTVLSRRDSIWPNSVINNIYCFADFGQFYQNQVEQL